MMTRKFISSPIAQLDFITIVLLIFGTACSACQAANTPAAEQLDTATQSINTTNAAFGNQGSFVPGKAQTATASPETRKKQWFFDWSFIKKNTPEPTAATNAKTNLIQYYAQSGDTLNAVASHFGIHPAKIQSPLPIPKDGLINPGQLLYIPDARYPPSPDTIYLDERLLIPDTDVVYGVSAVNFDAAQYIRSAGGYLADHEEYLGSTGWTSTSDVITRIALENSVNPRLLIALLEYENHCVLGDSPKELGEGYVLGIHDFRAKGLYGQLGWAINELSIGYYGWRDGSLKEIPLPNGKTIRPAPGMNAGTVALVYYFARLASQKVIQKVPVGQREYMGNIPLEDDLLKILDPEKGFPALYTQMFGDPWQREASFGFVYPVDMQSISLQLPFEPGVQWSYTSGPHQAWQTEGALAALDFAPATKQTGCVPSSVWVTAVADGPVVRVGDGIVIQDLDGYNALGQPAASDWLEQTGWAVLYMHIDTKDKVPEGTYLKTGDRIGHPSCEGGPATGTHLHIARKFNGEWVFADGPLPFIMSGWVPHAGEKPYEGTMTKDGITIIAHPYGSYETLISIPRATPAAEGTITPDKTENESER